MPIQQSTTSLEPTNTASSQPQKYMPPAVDPFHKSEAMHVVDEYLASDQRFDHYIIDTSLKFLQAGMPNDERIWKLSRHAAAQLSRKYPNDISMKGNDQLEATAQAICSHIYRNSEFLKDQCSSYQILPPMEVAYSTALNSTCQTAERLGRQMLTDTSIRNICTHMAYRMTRLSVDCAGNVELNGNDEITHYAALAKTYLKKKGMTANNFSPTEIQETGRWLAKQVINKANQMLPSELVDLWKEIGSIPDGRIGQYASARFEERSWLIDNLHSYHAPNKPVRHIKEAITQEIPVIAPTDRNTPVANGTITQSAQEISATPNNVNKQYVPDWFDEQGWPTIEPYDEHQSQTTTAEQADSPQSREARSTTHRSKDGTTNFLGDTATSKQPVGSRLKNEIERRTQHTVSRAKAATRNVTTEESHHPSTKNVGRSQ